MVGIGTVIGAVTGRAGPPGAGRDSATESTAAIASVATALAMMWSLRDRTTVIVFLGCWDVTWPSRTWADVVTTRLDDI